MQYLVLSVEVYFWGQVDHGSTPKNVYKAASFKEKSHKNTQYVVSEIQK